MNILEVEDMIKGMPDDSLFREAQQPTGQIPQFLVISEIQRRSDMRRRFQAQQQQPQATVKDQILQQGIGAMVPQQMQQDLGPQPPAAPQMGMPAQPGGMGAPAGAPMQAPVQMKEGGIVKMQDMGRVPSATPMGMNPYGRSSPSLYNVKPNPLYELLSFEDRRKSVLQGLRDRLARGEKLSTVELDALASYEAEFPGIQGPGAPSADTMARRERVGIGALSTPTVEERAAQIASAAPIGTIDDREGPPGDLQPGPEEQGAPMQSGIAGVAPQTAPASRFATDQLIAGATERTVDPGMMQLRNLLAAQEQRQSVDYGGFGERIKGQSEARMKEAEARVNELITEAEKETGKLSADARRDATAQALIQFGAGIAGGDISRGLEKAGTTAYAITAKARDEARDRMRQARAEGRSATDAARAAGDAAFNTMLQLDMKTEEGKVAAANALQDNRTSILTEMAKRAGDIEGDRRTILANLARTTAAIEQAAIDRVTEAMKTEGLNKRAVLNLVESVLKDNSSLLPVDASADQIGELVANIAASLSTKLGIDIGALPDGNGGEAGDNQLEVFSVTRVR